MRKGSDRLFVIVWLGQPPMLMKYLKIVKYLRPICDRMVWNEFLVAVTPI